MHTISTAFGSILVLTVGFSATVGRPNPALTSEELEDASISIIYSATDDDAQVFISGGSELPIRRIRVFAPSGHKVLDSKLRDPGQIGFADFQFETPEPSLPHLTASYPEGVYVFWGKSTDGTLLKGEFELSHHLLEAPEFTYPLNGDEGVPTDGLVVRWNPIANAEAVRFEIEDEEGEVALKVDLDGDSTEFEIPSDWLEDGVEYTTDVKAIAENGNITVSDVRFTTSL